MMVALYAGFVSSTVSMAGWAELCVQDSSVCAVAIDKGTAEVCWLAGLPRAHFQVFRSVLTVAQCPGASDLRPRGRSCFRIVWWLLVHSHIT